MKALVLAGGFPQIALINEIKSRGIEVVLTEHYKICLKASRLTFSIC